MDAEKHPETDFRRFPDEDKIEEIQDDLFELAWNKPDATSLAISAVVDRLSWVLSIWNKTFASETLSRILNNSFLSKISLAQSTAEQIAILQRLDLAICFFHHYIYAFDELINRKFRNSVIRCGLICERIVKRLAVATGDREVLNHPKLEARINKLRAELEGRFPKVNHLANFVQYVYGERTEKGAHDTKAASAIIAKSCITVTPNIYRLYLDALERVNYPVPAKDDLIELVNSTITTGTSLVLAEEGKSIGPRQVLESLYRRQYFLIPRGLADVLKELNRLGYNFPKPTVFKALNVMAGRAGLISKRGKKYFQRIPPEEFYKKEVVD